jgi:polysaccharide biosynthesis/export protein
VKRLTFLLACVALAGCSRSVELGGSPSISVVPAVEMPQPSSAPGAANRTFVLGPYDKLVVDVYGIEEMAAREMQVSSAGTIQFPLVGSISVIGKGTDDVATEIAARLREQYVRDPRVTVNMVENNSQLVTLDGSVAKPGLYPVIGGMTLVQAVASAGGTAEFAKLEEVVLFRSVNGQRYAGLYDLGAIRRGAYEDPRIYPNDVIVVGDSPSRRLFRDVVQAAPLITTPLLFLINN